jgi:hypothetical protein
VSRAQATASWKPEGVEKVPVESARIIDRMPFGETILHRLKENSDDVLTVQPEGGDPTGGLGEGDIHELAGLDAGLLSHPEVGGVQALGDNLGVAGCQWHERASVTKSV